MSLLCLKKKWVKKGGVKKKIPGGKGLYLGGGGDKGGTPENVKTNTVKRKGPEMENFLSILPGDIA